MKSILDPTFKYTNSASTNLKATFARIRKEQAAQEKKPPAVVPIKRASGR